MALSRSGAHTNLLQCGKDKARLHRTAHASPHNSAGKYIDDEFSLIFSVSTAPHPVGRGRSTTCGRDNLQNFADRPDPVDVFMRIDKIPQYWSRRSSSV